MPAKRAKPVKPAAAPKDRVPYSAIVDRPPLRLPGGGRVAVWTIVNVEEWSIERPMPRTVLPPPYGQPLLPDLPNWAWHEYGMRVGFWRFLDVLRSMKLRATLAINGSVIRSYPRVARAARDAGWEFMGHGYIQRPMHHVEDQRAAIRDTVAAIRKFTGAAPRGWESPGLTETFDTIDWLAEAGIEYVADWVLDDQPCTIKTRHGPVVSVPYTVEMNDIAMMAIQHHPSSEWLHRGIDTFDRLYLEGEKQARVMAISVHPYITGAPHRIAYLEKLYEYILAREGVVMWTGEEILDWYLKQRAPRQRPASARKKAK
jgi:peptidoglycan/xylan/chitin deacetylase (PgdA/CDA1 family)